MNITKNNVDALNAILTIELSREDYQENVDNVLKNYKKNASIPGFRKGAVPMSLVKKQYEKSVVFEEVNKLLQEKIGAYITEEKLDLLGNPLPIAKDIDWDAETLSFDFELGLAPEFTVNLTADNKLTKYQIVADEELLDKQVEGIQKQYGKLISQEKAEEESTIRVKAANEEKEIEKESTFNISDIRTKTNQKKFIGKKVGDQVTVSTKGLFEDDHKLMDVLGLDHEGIHGLEIEVTFTIEEITVSEKAELNQELFDKLFPEGEVTSVEQLKEKIKVDAEKQFTQQTDQKFSNDVIEYLVENTAFDLPSTFLKKWLQTAGEKELTEEEAAEEYAKSENGLRYQLIEGKIISENNLQLEFEELKSYTSDLIKQQMAQFGQLDPAPEDIEGIVARVLSNQDEVRRISEQLLQDKIKTLFTEKVKADTKEVTFDEFIKISYGE